MNENPQGKPRNLDLDGVMAALLRAGQRAREEAARTHTDVILVIDGKIERVSPADAEAMARHGSRDKKD